MPAALWLALALAADAPPDATQIMTQMASKMEAAIDERRQFVYHQSVRARLLKTNGQPTRQEKREYTAAPGPERTEKKLESMAGEYHKSKTEIIRYTEPGFEKGGMDIDGELIKDLIDDLVNAKKSRDGIPHGMFPLRTKDLPRYKFTYAGSSEHKDRPAHRIAFEPQQVKKHCLSFGDDDDDDDDDDDCRATWKGEALVDAEDLQPIRLFSDTTFRMPGAIKMFLGTNLQQVGFSVSYERVAPGVWFPVSYGSEFRVDLLFRYKRVITLALESKDFKRTGAESQITFEKASEK